MPCKVENCAKPGAYIRGMCPMHYQRWRLRGDPMWEPERATIEERFWEKVQKSDGCWEWTGGRDSRGYGAFKAIRMEKAHRYSWELQFGKIQENMDDMMAKGRSHRGERQYMARLTESDVREIRSAAERGENYWEIAKRFGIGRANVSQVVLRNTWKHVA